MQNFNIKDFESIIPTRGGVRSSRWTLGKIGNFRVNKFAIEEGDLWGVKFVEIKAIEIDNKLMIALSFSKLKEGLDNPFSVSSYESEDKKNRSLSFSGRGIFKKLKLILDEVVKDKSIVLKPEIKEQDGKKYFVIEIPVKT